MLPASAYRSALALHLRDINRAHSPNGKTYYGNAYARCLANARAAHPATDFTQPEPTMPTPKVKPLKMQVLPANKPAPKRNLSRHLAKSPSADMARVPYAAYAPSVPPRPLGSGAYSGAVVSAYGYEAVARLIRS